jgi:hypothetical protein
MLDWLKSLGPKPTHQGKGESAPAGPQRVMSGKYLLLYEYLENRYANTVVLTFAEIEDLLGFTLPDLAGSRQEWWTDGKVNITGPHYSDSWILASRTATPNLVARTVVFERGS